MTTSTINQIHERNLERNRAFGAVLDIRDKLKAASNQLAAIEADLVARPRQPVDNRDRYRSYVADLESKLADAERYCMECNPDRLLDHDAKIAAAEQAAEQAREAEEWPVSLVGHQGR